MDREIKKILKPIKLLGVLVLVSAVVFYVLGHVEDRNVSLLQCLYMVAITISTAGYEDPLHCTESTLLMTFTICMIFLYMVVVAYAISNFTAFLVEGRIKKYFQLKTFLKRIKKMDQHYIICGIKDIGVFAAKELEDTKRSFVVVEQDTNAIASLHQEIPSLVWLEGDATDDNVLEQAGIKRAKAIIAAMDDDKENLYLVLAAKELNPSIEIAAKFNSPKARKKLAAAGAKHLVCPYRIGGLRIASELLRPQVVSFLDGMMRSTQDAGVRIEDLTVPEGSSFVGQTLKNLYDKTGVLVISYRWEQSQQLIYNPKGETEIKGGMHLIFIASAEQRVGLEKALGV
ncbi:MAG: potassium channel protein [Sedimentisphaerales bacterium]|nr:potassium channel protein [Sedimentisphaerales bacterium]